jgi:hypothetical protein
VDGSSQIDGRSGMSAPESLLRLRKNLSKARKRPQKGQIGCEFWLELGQVAKYHEAKNRQVRITYHAW